jgi:acyl-CoA reductase-like NAD-dependent aldehyde dehydrogenase
MSNAGQTCIGIERVYVAEPVYDEFVNELRAQVASVRPGSDPEAPYGPITMPSQVDVIKRHVSDALARGGRALTGGAVDGVYVEPTILVDVPEDSPAVQEETFGPTLTVTKVRSVDEALALTNATSYGLAGAVFTRSKERGMELARRMRSGMTSINSVIAFASVPTLPFGGVGDSGFGRIHGEDGLKEFTRPKAITRQRFALPTPLMTFKRNPKLTEQLAKVMGMVHGRA